MTEQQRTTEFDPPAADEPVGAGSAEPAGPQPAPFTTDTAASHAQDLTAKYKPLTPRAVEPTANNPNHALRIEDPKDGWFAEIAIDDDTHHAWLTEQIEAHLAATKR
jgi:hypothetical protein